MFIGVHPDINASGLGTQIIQQSKKLAKEKGLDLQIANCAAVASLKAFTKAGFEPAVTFPYSEFLDHGRPVFGEQVDDGQALTMVAIRH
uniref:N-acetyltransferase domain-containing protein n=1 Tax=Panagrolaimus sp. JU765 TaxID=591449 RepID=A0AC34QN42_9BILA